MKEKKLENSILKILNDSNEAPPVVIQLWAAFTQPNRFIGYQVLDGK